VFVRTLRGFSYDGSRIRLSPDTAIQVPSERDLLALREKGLSFPGIGPDRFAVKTVEFGGERAAESAAAKKFGRALVALQLLQPRRVEYGDSVAYQPGVRGSARDPWFLEPSEFNPLQLPPRYDLPRREAATLRRIYSGLTANKNDQVEVALRRYALGLERIRAEDSFVDVWVGLEALFSDGPGELTYKIAVRVAHYLGENPVRRWEMFEHLKDSYKLRSLVVHGRSPRNLASVHSETRDILRRALRKTALIGAPETKDLDGHAVRGPSVT